MQNTELMHHAAAAQRRPLSLQDNRSLSAARLTEQPAASTCDITALPWLRPQPGLQLFSVSYHVPDDLMDTISDAALIFPSESA